MASKLLNDARDPKTKKHLWKVDAIERALADDESDAVRGAYHRGEHESTEVSQL